MKSRLWITGLVILLSCQLVLAQAPQNSATTPEHRHSWWTVRNDAVNERVKQGHVDLILVGDSITHGWDNVPMLWNQYYAPRNAVNMGFGGDRTQHVLWRFDHGHLDGISPKLAILMIGTNNSNGNDNTAEEIADGIIAICRKLQSKCPHTKILMLAIFPRNPDPSPQREKNAKASLLASKIADNKTIFYMDINDQFLAADGKLPKEIMPDFLHPNEAGYKIWAEAIEPKVAELMGDKNRTKDSDPIPLFNGKDLTGWKAEGGAKWTVVDGMLVGTQGDNNAPGDLFTTASFKDFDLTTVWRVEWPCNSGVWFRYQGPDKAYQADILEWKNPVCWSGTFYCPSKMFLAMNTDEKLVNRDGWNTIRIRTEGNHTQIWLNDKQVADVNDDTTDSGKIGFQVHPGAEFGPMKITIKDIRIKPL